MGSMSQKGMLTSLPVSASTPRRTGGVREPSDRAREKAKANNGALTGRSSNQATDIIGSLNSFASVPTNVVFVGEPGRCESGAVVTAPADKH